MYVRMHVYVFILYNNTHIGVRISQTSGDTEVQCRPLGTLKYVSVPSLRSPYPEVVFYILGIVGTGLPISRLK